MRKLLFLFFVALTWYLAAMYRMDTLMILAVMEVLIFLCMFFCVNYFKRNMRSGFLEKHLVLNRREESECPFWTENQGILPISRFRIRFTFAYDEEMLGRRLSFLGNVDRKKREQECVMPETPWSGTLFLSMEKVEVYDYLSLFKGKIKCEDRIQVTVLPPDRQMSIGLPAQMAENESDAVLEEELRRGELEEEFVQLREYVPGDTYRHIHWKQSARTDTLLVKEYRQEQKKSVFLFLDFQGYEEADIEKTSVFYEILWALVTGLSKETALQIGWRDSEEQSIERRIMDPDTRAAVFVELYEKDWSGKKYTVPSEETGMVLQFGIDLRLIYREKEIARFTVKDYEEQMEQIEIGL